MLRWVAFLGATVTAGALLNLVGIPSPYLFGALLAGLAVALLKPGSFVVPEPVFPVAQAIVGVVLGAYLQSSSLRAVEHAWLPVALVSAGTLGVCLAAGYVMARVTAVDRPTAALGMVAGGASGILSMAEELGADDRLVAFMQYARVLVVVLVTPVLTGLFFPGHHADASAVPDVPLIGSLKDWVIVAACAPAGALAARAIKLPAGTLLGPMAVAGTLTLTGALGHFVVPDLIQEAAFIVIGLQVGLRFTVQTVREVGALLVPVLISIVVLLAACFLLALGLTATTDVSLFNAYLATTPGGLYAVLAVAFGAGANTTFILAVQSLRLLVMVLLAPLVVRRTIPPVLSAGRGSR